MTSKNLSINEQLIEQEIKFDKKYADLELYSHNLIQELKESQLWKIVQLNTIISKYQDIEKME